MKKTKTKTKKNKKMKGGVELNALFPRQGGETVQQYVNRIEGQRLPRYRTELPMRKTFERGNNRNETHQAFLNRLRRRLAYIVRESPVEEERPDSPELSERTPIHPRMSRRPRKNTRSAPVKSSKSKKSKMKLALKGSYKRNRHSAPTRKKMSSRKAKNFIMREKLKKTKKTKKQSGG